jgi:hypothetical protein
VNGPLTFTFLLGSVPANGATLRIGITVVFDALASTPHERPPPTRTGRRFDVGEPPVILSGYRPRAWSWITAETNSAVCGG